MVVQSATRVTLPLRSVALVVPVSEKTPIFCFIFVFVFIFWFIYFIINIIINVIVMLVVIVIIITIIIVTISVVFIVLGFVLFLNFVSCERSDVGYFISVTFTRSV